MGLGDLIDRSRSAIVDVAEGVRDGFVELAHTENPEAFIGSLLGLDGPAVEGVHFDVVQFMPDEVTDLLPENGGGALSRWLHLSGMDWDFRRMLFWLSVIMVFVLIAVLTNPTEASFRTHLTELSFRRHLAVIRSNDDHTPDSTLPTTSQTTIISSTGHDPHTSYDETKPTPPTITLGTSTPTSCPETPPIAPFRFSNHVAISLRTPMLYFRSLFIISIALTSPIGPPAFLSDPPHLPGKKNAVSRETLVLYLGFLGYWAQIGVVPAKMEWAYRVLMEGPKEKGRKKAVVDKPGVLELKAMPGKEEVIAGTPSKGATPLHTSKIHKTVRRMGSTNDLHDVTHSSLHSLPTIPIPTQPVSRRPSLVSLLPPPTTTSEPADTPTLIALKSDLSKAQDTLLDLKTQLLSNEQTVSDAQASLQSSLDELRNKRKEDDVERQELKSRTKHFEEQKRQAESARKDAEKRLKVAEVARDTILGKIESAKKEMGDIRSQTISSQAMAKSLVEEGQVYVRQTREAVEGRKVDLERLEEEMTRVEGEHEEISVKVREAEERLRTTQEQMEAAKKIGPEEEMMMMAAAYEAAAQEGYMYGQQGGGGGGGGGHGHTPAPHPGGHNTHSANWASQAAAYMAEAGMPLLDQSYTARQPINSRLPSGETRLADLTGFEDFGPGSHAHGHQVNGGTGDGFGQILGHAATRLNTPPSTDYSSESEIYGLDPGSPNGGISTSFSANLLPQGLFRSLLGGDVTPIDDEAGSTLSEALNFAPPPMDLSAPSPEEVQEEGQGNGTGDAGSESGDETDDIWRSPMSEVNHPIESNPHKPETTPANNRVKRFSFSRLLPPSTTSPSRTSPTPAVLTGLPPVSRRWFSGTSSASAENLHAFPLFQANGSSDSLGHPASLSLGGDSPFAPSEKEKKQLAQKWGPLSKYRWAAPSGSGNEAVGGGVGLGRSTSLELTNSPAPHSRGLSAPTESPTASGGQSWMARHLHVNAYGSTPPPPSSSSPAGKSPLIPTPNRISTDLLADDELDYHSLIPTPIANLGSSADSKEDKKSFKFFSLRKSQGGSGSGGIGTSPG